MTLSSPKTRSSRRRTNTIASPSSGRAQTPKSSKKTTIDVPSDDEIISQDGVSSTGVVKNKEWRRLEAAKNKLALLERDNYLDLKGGSSGAALSFGLEEEIWSDDELSANKRKKKTHPETPKKRKKDETGGSKKRSVKFVKRKLENVLLNLDKVDLSPEPNYYSVVAPPSIYPQRKFCEITGFISNYTCPHTGKHYLNVQAYEHIKKDNALE